MYMQIIISNLGQNQEEEVKYKMQHTEKDEEDGARVEGGGRSEVEDGAWGEGGGRRSEVEDGA